MVFFYTVDQILKVAEIFSDFSRIWIFLRLIFFEAPNFKLHENMSNGRAALIYATRRTVRRDEASRFPSLLKGKRLNVEVVLTRKSAFQLQTFISSCCSGQ